MANELHGFEFGSNLNLCSAFSTSPSQLQEVTLDPELSGKVSISQIQTAFTNSIGESVSSSSMKQYEEQLANLRKENFQLKLRIYFLEERLGNSTPVPMQDILEDNVKFQVELEELRRQLSEKQELLTAAAKAMDVLEQQVGKNAIYSKDIVYESDDCSTLKYKVQQLDEFMLDGDSVLKKNQKSDENIDSLSASGNAIQEITENEKKELMKLKRDHLTACQMIRGCMSRIKKMEKDIKDKDIKLEDLAKNLEITETRHDVNELLDKMKLKDDHILELERKLILSETESNSLKTNQNAITTTGNNLQELLTKRLQGLTYFLDSLLSHKCVIGQEKREMAKNLLEQSLAFLDETMAADLTVDDSNLDVSKLLKLEDLSLLFGHHQVGQRPDTLPNPHLDVTWADTAPSESDCWSEPDRSVSLARMGLSIANNLNTTSEESHCRNLRKRSTIPSRMDQSELEKKDALLVEISNLTRDKLHLEEKLKEHLELPKELLEEIDILRDKLKVVSSEKDGQIEKLKVFQYRVAKLEDDLKQKENELILYKSQFDEIDALYKNEKDNMYKLKTELQSCEDKYKTKLRLSDEQIAELREIERDLRRQVDEATLQASQSALDRTRNAHERLHAERNLEQLKVQLEDSEKLRRDAELKVAALDVKLSELAGEQEILQQQLQLAQVLNSDNERPTSPDLGIDSDRLSSLENIHMDLHQLSKSQLWRDNKELREKLERSKIALAEAVSHLNEANSRKHKVHRAICRQIHKTHDVLRQARTNLQPLQRLQPNEP